MPTVVHICLSEREEKKKYRSGIPFGIWTSNVWLNVGKSTEKITQSFISCKKKKKAAATAWHFGGMLWGFRWKIRKQNRNDIITHDKETHTHTHQIIVLCTVNTFLWFIGCCFFFSIVTASSLSWLFEHLC